MSENVAVELSAHFGQGLWAAPKPEQKRRPNVVGVGAWLQQAKTMRRPVEYVGRHRAPGPAV